MEEKKMDISGLSKKEYLKKYLSGGEKKKKKKKSTQSLIIKSKIVDDDIDLKNMRPVNEDELEIFDVAEDAPQIAGIIDDRPEEIRIMSEYRSTKKWKIVTDEFGIEDVKITAIDRERSNDGSPKREKEISIEIRKNSNTNRSDSEDSSTKRNSSKSQTDNFKILKTNVKIERDASPLPQRKELEDSDTSMSARKEKFVSNVSPSRRKKRRDSDESPPRRRNRKEDSDESPPRRRDRKEDSDESPPRRRDRKEDSDESPPRRRDRKEDSDESPPRRKNRKEESDESPPRRRKRKEDSDESPPRRRRRRRRRRKEDSDESPPRRRKKKEDSDESPPRRKKSINADANRNSKRYDSDLDCSFSSKIKKEKDLDSYSSRNNHFQDDLNSSQRRDKYNSKETFRDRYHSNSKNYDINSENGNERRKEREKSKTPTRGDVSKNLEKDDRYGLKLSKNHKDNSTKENQSSQLSKTLSGKKAGLQSASDMRKESEKLRQKEAEAFQRMPDEVTGRNAQAILRDRKTGRRRDAKEEARKKREKEEEEAERIAKYAVWGKGVKQVQDSQEKLKDDLYEMSKPLARYKDDKDLDEMLKNQEREGDPMLEYIRRKKQKENPKSLIPEYEGPYMPNRYGIKPGHKWDGVDRSNGYEKRWFEEQSARKAREEEAFKWSTADM